MTSDEYCADRRYSHFRGASSSGGNPGGLTLARHSRGGRRTSRHNKINNYERPFFARVPRIVIRHVCVCALCNDEKTAIGNLDTIR
jgi:hypothetical protein